MRVSAVIIAKNEEAKLPGCLKSLFWCNEIVLVDDFSNDQTVAIAKGYGAKIFQRKLDGYANQKNFAVSKAANAWVIVVDADERVPAALQKEIRSLKPVTGVVAYTLPRKNLLGKKWLKHGGLYPDWQVRLFNRHYAQYGSRQIHETLNVRGKTGQLKHALLHLTYRNIADYYRKVKRYAKLEAATAESRPSIKDVFKTFYRKYVKLQGYKDGWAGLISAKLLAYYEWLKRRQMRKS